MANALRSTIDLTHRRDEAEWLDGADISPTELEKVLRDLASFNQTFLGHYPILRWLRRAIKSAPAGIPLTVVDVGCGYGDLLRAIRRWSRRYKPDLKLVGVDLNPETIRIARTVTEPADRIDFQARDIFELAPTMGVDFMVNSLVTHHLADDEISEFMRLMERIARRGWLICDLQRHRFLYHFIGLSGRLAGLHPMVVHDGQISVTRSLRRKEWKERIAAAGLAPADVAVRWFS